jgi:hypothetical protein
LTACVFSTYGFLAIFRKNSDMDVFLLKNFGVRLGCAVVPNDGTAAQNVECCE